MIVPLLYRWIALAALVGAAMLFAAMQMHAHDSKAQAAFVADVKAEGNKQLEHTAQVITRQKGINDETVNAYSNDLAALRSYYDNKLRSSAHSGQVPAVSATACGIDESPANNGLATTVTHALIPSSRPLDARCAETTLQLVSLQQWINNQAKATNGNGR